MRGKRESFDESANPVRAPVTQSQLLESQIEGSIHSVRWVRDFNKRRASIIRIGSLVASTAVTVLLGLKIASADAYLQQTAFVLGATVTLLSALEPFFNYRALWIDHDQALADLYELRNDLAFFLMGPEPDVNKNANDLDAFRIRHNAIWSRLSKAWVEHRRSGSREVASEEQETAKTTK
jgi:hypothetical protein